MTMTRPTLIHIHIPKTAGSTLNAVLSEALGEHRQFPCAGVEDVEELAAMSQAERDQIDFVFGHYPYGLHRLFTRPVCYMACLREPRQRILSFYRFVLTKEDHPLYRTVRRNSHDFSSFLKISPTVDRIQDAVDNVQVRMLSGDMEHRAEYEDSLGLARSTIEAENFFLGDMQFLDVFLARVEQEMHLKLGPVPRLNASKDTTSFDEEMERLDPGARDILEHFAKWDTILYSAAREAAENGDRRISSPSRAVAAATESTGVSAGMGAPVSDDTLVRELVTALYRVLLLREPDPIGLRASAEDIRDGRIPIADLMRRMLASKEFGRRRAQFLQTYVPPDFPTEDGVIPLSDVTVCMIVLNEEEFLPPTLRAMAKHFRSFVIADMGSSDRTLGVINEILGDRARLVHYPKEKLVEEGYASARNFCAAFATTPWILMVDADEVVVSGLDAGGIRIDCPLDSAAMATIEIDHLKKPEAGPPVREVRSTTTHRRLYRTDAGVTWGGYIHEALSLEPGSGSKATTIAKSSIRVDHFTEFKDAVRSNRKRGMYFWMLLRAFENPKLRFGTNSYWYDEFVPDNLEMIKAGARAFAERVESAKESIAADTSPWAELGVDHERIHDLACVRKLHTVPSRPWTASGARALWCEWNHPGERSRPLQSIIDDAAAMKWPRFIKPGSTCIDIGAHSGDTAIPMGLLSFDKMSNRRGTVVAIEPNPDVFRVLEVNLELNSHIADFKCLKAAITRVDTPAIEMADHGNSNCNGGILDDSYSDELRARLEKAAQIKYVTRGMSLETLFKELGPSVAPQSVSFIKIDCEGYDKEIIRSARTFLNEIKPTLFVEWFAWFTLADDEDFFRAIDEVGYVALYPATLEPADRAKKVANVVCVHRAVMSSTL